MEDLKYELKKEPVTASLVVLNLIAFFISEIMGGSQDTQVMLEAGAAYTPFILEKGEYYRLFTCMFLHFGIEHLLNNMLILFVIGGRLERTLGKLRLVIIYILGGLGGNIISMFLEMKNMDYHVSAGASGAVFAVMGALLYVVIRHKGRVEDLSAKQIVFMAALSLYFGFTSTGVDNAAHVGGLLVGAFLAVLLYHPKKNRKETDTWWS